MPSGLSECPKCHQKIGNRWFKEHVAKCDGSGKSDAEDFIDSAVDVHNDHKNGKASNAEEPKKYTNPVVENGLKPPKRYNPKMDGNKNSNTLTRLLNNGILTVNVEQLLKCKHMMTAVDNYVRLEFDISDLEKIEESE